MCGLHEVATGDKDSEADQKARVFIGQLLVQCGADPDNRQHGCGGTPLHHTLAGGYLELVKFLLNAGADVNAISSLLRFDVDDTADDRAAISSFTL